MTTVRHHQEAREEACAALKSLLQTGEIGQALLVDDLRGLLRVVVWPNERGIASRIESVTKKHLARAAGRFWSGEVLVADPALAAELAMAKILWEQGNPVGGAGGGGLRMLERHLNRTAWFGRAYEPPWAIADAGRRARPPIVAFLSFKGGVGRTTALASFAIQRARKGEHVAVVDFDLDAPGLGPLLSDEPPQAMAAHGVVDYLLERHAIKKPDIADYMHACSRQGIVEDGRISVFPAGVVDDFYLSKLSRIDLELPDPQQPHPLDGLLHAIASMPQGPDWLLIDGRAGLSPAAGLLLTGLAHMHVLVGTASAQSFAGLRRMVSRLGAERLLGQPRLPQAECMVVQSMVPDNSIVAKKAVPAFEDEIERIFRDVYYAPGRDENDLIWSLDDLENARAPHRPAHLFYRGELAFFDSIDTIADSLATDRHYVAFGDHLVERLGRA